MSIPELAREIITRNRSIYDCMKMDLINYTALAVKIQPEIEKILGNSVNLNTVVVAIKRYADSFEIKEDIKEESVLKNARLALTDGMMDIRFSAKDSSWHGPEGNFGKILKDNQATTNFSDSLTLLDFLQRMWRISGRYLAAFTDGDEMFSTGLAKIRISIPASSESDQMWYPMLQRCCMQMGWSW